MFKKPDFVGKGAIAGNPKRRRQELSDEQRQEIKEAFELFDTDKTGTIDYHELDLHIHRRTTDPAHSAGPPAAARGVWAAPSAPGAPGEYYRR